MDEPVAWHAAHAAAPSGWDAGRAPAARRHRSPVTRDMLAGDTPALFAARLAWMDGDPARRRSVAAMSCDLHARLSRMTAEEALAPDRDSTGPRMRIRHIHDGIVAKARHRHCHAGLYRSAGAAACMAAGGLYRPPKALLHCEHTIPVAVIAPMLWTLVDRGDLPKPKDLLAWILGHTIVSILHASERGGDDVGVARPRSFGGGPASAWVDAHPDLPAGAIVEDRTRPFLRYVGTGLSIEEWFGGEVIDLADATIAEHRRRVSDIPLYDAARYFA